MRIPRRLQPPVVKEKPRAFQSVRFVHCLRCMGHGYFQTNPSDERPMAAFSREAALLYLEYLGESGLVSCNQYATLEQQIATSPLPYETPRAVQEIMSRCAAWEEKRVELASIGQAAPVPFELFGMDVAERVHEFLLTSSDYPHLRTQ